MTGRFGLLGERLAHSYSPLIHSELGDYEYKLYEKKPEELDEFFRRGDFDGLNVTIPYKIAVIPFCGALSETARAIGSVNTVTRLDDGTLYGDNTDYFGFSYLIKKTGVEPTAGKSIILGSGGSSLTAQAVLHDMGAGEAVVVSRSGADNYENIKKHGDAVLIINTTPVGMYPDNGVSPINDLAVFHNCLAVIDLIYNPLKTTLLLEAEERGLISVNGLAMLAAQAKRAAELFTRTTIPDGIIETVTSKIARMTRNIILIGMPGCGKSSVGAALAEKTGREFADTDDWVVKAAGKSIPDIFAADGEEAFRKLESDVLKTLCKRGGLVIATGGGIVKRRENRNALKQNGTVIFLDRDIAELPASGRPLSEKEGAAALAAARLPLYAQWSDHTVPVRGVEQTAADIFRRFTEGALS